MKARQPELRGIPQFDSGRWKLRLERVPPAPDNETTMGSALPGNAIKSVVRSRPIIPMSKIKARNEL